MTTERAGSTACRRANSSTRPGSGGRHQQVGGPAACEQSAASTAPDTISRDGGRGGVELGGRAVGAPVEDEMRRRGLGRRERSLPLGRAIRDRSHEDARREPIRMRHPLERNALHAREALVVGRRLELAERSHLLRRREKSRLGACGLLQLLRLREVAESVEQAFDHVDLCLRERGIEPDAACGDAVAGTRLDDVAARGARQVRVVEDDFACSGSQRLVQRVGKLPERPAPRVAVEPEVATRHVVLGDA